MAGPRGPGPVYRGPVDEAKRKFDDCYFYFYSTCRKGDSCPFRHCEAALGTETVCAEWRVGNCLRVTCPLRHMESVKDRSTIPCYWENQPGGCRKPHCVFRHFKTHERPDEASPTRKENHWTPEDGASKPGFSRGGNMRNPGSPPEECEEAGVPQLPPVEPLVVNFDEESDSESCKSTPVKSSSNERKVSFAPMDRLSAKTKHTSARMLLNKKPQIDDEEDTGDFLDFGIKTLDEIRQQKIKVESAEKSKHSTQFPEVKIEVSNAALQNDDLRNRLTRKIIVINSVPDSASMGFKIKTLDELRQERGTQDFVEVAAIDDNVENKPHLDNMTPFQDQVDVLNYSDNENNSPSANQNDDSIQGNDGGLESLLVNEISEEINLPDLANATQSPSSKGRWADAVAARKRNSRKRNSVELYRPPKATRVDDAISPKKTRKDVQPEKYTKDLQPSKEIHIKTLAEIRQEKMLESVIVPLSQEHDENKDGCGKPSTNMDVCPQDVKSVSQKRNADCASLMPFVSKKLRLLRPKLSPKKTNTDMDNQVIGNKMKNFSSQDLVTSTTGEPLEEGNVERLSRTEQGGHVITDDASIVTCSNVAPKENISPLERLQFSPPAPPSCDSSGGKEQIETSPVVAAARRRLESNGTRTSDERTPTSASRRKDSSSLRVNSTELDDELDLFLGGEDEVDLEDSGDVKEDELLLELDEMINS